MREPLTRAQSALSLSRQSVPTVLARSHHRRLMDFTPPDTAEMRQMRLD